MTSNSNSGRDTTDGLPKQFLSSLRILFDILDENQTGFIRLRDIESRWSDDGVRGLPPGVVEGLRKVTPLNGLLSFERFVAGLKLVLTKTPDTDIRRPLILFKENRPYSDRSRPASSEIKNDRYRGDSHNGQQSIYRQHTHVNPSHNTRNSAANDTQSSYFNNQTNEYQRPEQAQRLNKVDHSAHTTKPEPKNSYSNPSTTFQGSSRHINNNLAYNKSVEQPPAVPPRRDQPFQSNNNTTTQIRKSVSGPNLQTSSTSPPAIPPRDAQSSTRILNELKSWQREWGASQSSDYNKSNATEKHDRMKYSQDGTIYANIEDFQGKDAPTKATVRRHGSGRRHTLANGIDQNMMKKMKQLEEEMTVLRSGLAMVDTAREWYQKQIQAVTNKQAMLDKVKFNDTSVDAHQEKMNFQRARIGEVNKHLHTLIESSEKTIMVLRKCDRLKSKIIKGFPFHMNLAVSGLGPSLSSNEPSVQSIKEHNRKLLEELNQKKELIGQLEKEKSTLVRELFEVRSKNKTSFDDTTFM